MVYQARQYRPESTHTIGSFAGSDIVDNGIPQVHRNIRVERLNFQDLNPNLSQGNYDAIILPANLTESWIGSADVPKYVKKNPDAHRDKLVDAVRKHYGERVPIVFTGIGKVPDELPDRSEIYAAPFQISWRVPFPGHPTAHLSAVRDLADTVDDILQN